MSLILLGIVSASVARCRLLPLPLLPRCCHSLSSTERTPRMIQHPCLFDIWPQSLLAEALRHILPKTSSIHSEFIPNSSPPGQILSEEVLRASDRLDHASVKVPRNTGRTNILSLALEVSILLGQILSGQDMALVREFAKRGNKDYVHARSPCWCLEPLH